MSETITPAVSDRICKHMNEDHGEALILYAQFFGKVDSVTSAKMLSIDEQGMNLILNNSQDHTIRIKFDHKLQDAEDAHHILVEMLKQARRH
jgi:putative heme iron utilization protein